MSKLKIENLVPLILISLLIQVFLWILIGGAAEAYLGLKFGMELAITISIILKLGLGFLINLIIAFWIIKIVKSEGKKPLSWFILTVFFGLIAVALLYLDLIYAELKKDKGNTDSKQ